MNDYQVKLVGNDLISSVSLEALRGIIYFKRKRGDMKKETIKVNGMSCAACSARVEKVIEKMNGVSEASVNLATGKATFTFNENEIGRASCRERV